MKQRTAVDRTRALHCAQTHQSKALLCFALLPSAGLLRTLLLPLMSSDALQLVVIGVAELVAAPRKAANGLMQFHTLTVRGRLCSATVQRPVVWWQSARFVSISHRALRTRAAAPLHCWRCECVHSLQVCAYV